MRVVEEIGSSPETEIQTEAGMSQQAGEGEEQPEIVAIAAQPTVALAEESEAWVPEIEVECGAEVFRGDQPDGAAREPEMWEHLSGNDSARRVQVSVEACLVFLGELKVIGRGGKNHGKKKDEVRRVLPLSLADQGMVVAVGIWSPIAERCEAALAESFDSVAEGYYMSR